MRFPQKRHKNPCRSPALPTAQTIPRGIPRRSQKISVGSSPKLQQKPQSQRSAPGQKTGHFHAHRDSRHARLRKAPAERDGPLQKRQIGPAHLP